jgi:hypothetical protein
MMKIAFRVIFYDATDSKMDANKIGILLMVSDFNEN